MKHVMKIVFMALVVILLQSIGLMQFDGIGAMAEPVGMSQQLMPHVGASDSGFVCAADNDLRSLLLVGSFNNKEGPLQYRADTASQDIDDGETVQQTAIAVLAVPRSVIVRKTAIEHDQDACAPPMNVVYTG